MNDERSLIITHVGNLAFDAFYEYPPDDCKDDSFFAIDYTISDSFDDGGVTGVIAVSNRSITCYSMVRVKHDNKNFYEDTEAAEADAEDLATAAAHALIQNMHYELLNRETVAFQISGHRYMGVKLTFNKYNKEAIS